MVLTTSMAQLPHHRFVAWGWVVGISIGAALAVGAVAWTTSDASASDAGPTPSASPSALQPAEIPETIAQAPRMTADVWDQVDGSWDVLSVGWTDGAGTPRAKGSLALYLTPPGGERMLAFANEDLPDTTLRAVAWDPESLFMLMTNAIGEFHVLDMRTGTYMEVAGPVDGPLAQVVPLGRASDGRSYLALTEGYESEGPVVIAAWDGTGWIGEVVEGFAAAGTLRNDVTIVNVDGGLREFNVVTGTGSAPIDGLEGCWFASWASDSEFSAGCATASDGGADVLGANLETGSVEMLGRYEPEGYHWASPLAVITGTPIVASSVGDGSLQLGVLTNGGVHTVGVCPQEVAVAAVLAADSRWVVHGSDVFPCVLDARRGTLDYLGDDFTWPPHQVTFLPGVRTE